MEGEGQPSETRLSAAIVNFEVKSNASSSSSSNIENTSVVNLWGKPSAHTNQIDCGNYSRAHSVHHDTDNDRSSKSSMITTRDLWLAELERLRQLELESEPVLYEPMLLQAEAASTTPSPTSAAHSGSSRYYYNFIPQPPSNPYEDQAQATRLAHGDDVEMASSGLWGRPCHRNQLLNPDGMVTKDSSDSVRTARSSNSKKSVAFIVPHTTESEDENSTMNGSSALAHQFVDCDSTTTDEGDDDLSLLTPVQPGAADGYLSWVSLQVSRGIVVDREQPSTSVGSKQIGPPRRRLVADEAIHTAPVTTGRMLSEKDGVVVEQVPEEDNSIVSNLSASSYKIMSKVNPYDNIDDAITIVSMSYDVGPSVPAIQHGVWDPSMASPNNSSSSASEYYGINRKDGGIGSILRGREMYHVDNDYNSSSSSANKQRQKYKDSRSRKSKHSRKRTSSTSQRISSAFSSKRPLRPALESISHSNGRRVSPHRSTSTLADISRNTATNQSASDDNSITSSDMTHTSSRHRASFMSSVSSIESVVVDKKLVGSCHSRTKRYSIRGDDNSVSSLLAQDVLKMNNCDIEELIDEGIILTDSQQNTGGAEQPSSSDAGSTSSNDKDSSSMYYYLDCKKLGQNIINNCARLAGRDFDGSADSTSDNSNSRVQKKHLFKIPKVWLFIILLVVFLLEILATFAFIVAKSLK